MFKWIKNLKGITKFKLGLSVLLTLLFICCGWLYLDETTVKLWASDNLVSIGISSKISTNIPQYELSDKVQRYIGESTVEQTSWGYRYQLGNGDIVEVGDSATSDFKANVKTIRWDEVCWFSLGWTGGTFTPSLNGLTISFPFNSSTNVSIYPVEPSSRLPEGGIEYDIQLTRRPAQNTITLNVDWQGITWQKILPLDAEYDEAKCIDIFGSQGSPYIRTATSIIGTDGITYKTRPEYEVNSYLGTATIPHKDTSVMGWNETTQQPITYTKIDTTHLYIHRGEMTDTLGNKAWVEDINLDEVNKTTTFTLPREWLRNATYPVNQVCGVDPAYTQAMTSFQSTAFTGGDGVWSDLDITAYAGDSVVAEIIMSNSTTGTENAMGVRANGSGLARYVTLHEAEGGGQTHSRMFVQTDASGIIECYHSDVSDADYFYIVGYWSNVTFTEAFNIENQTGFGSWEDVTLNSGASCVHPIIIRNAEADTANTMGVRANGSSLNRFLKVHEPESGGSNLLDMLVKADASAVIELVTDDYVNTNFYDTGYFSSEMDFVELWQAEALTSTTWTQWDITAYLDQDGRMCDFLTVHSTEAGTVTMGVRDGDDADTNRYLVEHEAESAGAGGEYTGFGMSAESNASGLVYVYNPTNAIIYLTGYFKPTSTFDISNTPSSKAFGIVATSTTYWAIGHTPDNPIDDAHCTFTLTNNGATAIDLDAHVDDFTGGVGWNIGAPAENQARITWFKSGDNPASGIVLTNSDQEVYDGLAASGHFHWEIKLETPTSNTDGVAKSTTLTMTAATED